MNTLLHLDVSFVSRESRQKLEDELVKMKWEKVSLLQTLWKKFWSDGTTPDRYVAAARREVAAATHAAGISGYTAAISISTSDVVTWKTRCTSGVLHAIDRRAADPIQIPGEYWVPCI